MNSVQNPFGKECGHNCKGHESHFFMIWGQNSRFDKLHMEPTNTRQLVEDHKYIFSGRNFMSISIPRDPKFPTFLLLVVTSQKVIKPEFNKVLI